MPSGVPTDCDPTAGDESPDHPLLEKLDEFFHTRLETISVPFLAVVGEKDTELARDAVPLLVATIPGARGAQVPRVGHQWNAEAPELFTEMVRAWVDDAAVHPDLLEKWR